jgi:1,4-alpha-glucan branching enzyme
VKPKEPWQRPWGARPLGDGSVEFRVWAPRATSSVALKFGSSELPMEPVGGGVWETVVPASSREDYWFRLDGDRELPDPSSRWQPSGLRGPSRVVAVDAPQPFTMPARERLVIYELHIGTFTPEGTFASAITQLAELASLGVTAFEVMPVVEFPGRHGWGYDGVYLSAAHSAYGGPLGFRRLIDAAHAAGIGVILDVVYNHVGASGQKALEAFGPYFTDRYETPWGKAINYDDEGSEAVREWVCQSAEGWIGDFGVDGLRLDAIHSIFDSSPEPIVAAVARRAHAMRKDAVVIAENDLPDVGNRAFGDRLSRELAPLAAFCVLLSPFVPLLFMGEEYGEPAPFQFFCDHIDAEIARATREGRREEFKAFAKFAAAEIPDPQDPATFARSKLTRLRDPVIMELYRRLLVPIRDGQVELLGLSGAVIR